MMLSLPQRFFSLCLILLLTLAACTPEGLNPPPTGEPNTPASHRFTLSAEGHDALLGDYEETFQGNASYAGSRLQLWSDSETPNRVLQISYQGGGTIPVGTYTAVGSEAQVTDSATQAVVTYLLAQGAFCTGCQPREEPIADYYLEYLATGGTVTVTSASSGRLTGTVALRVERHSYYADLEGTFNAALGR